MNNEDNNIEHPIAAEIESAAESPDMLIVDENVQKPLAMRQILVGGVGFLAFLTLIVWGVNAIGQDTLRMWVEGAGVFAPLVYIAIKAVTYIFAPLTSGPIQVVAGTLFGNIWLGTLYTLIGEVIGGSVSFWLARRYGRPLVQRLVGTSGMRQVEDFYHKRMGGWLSLAVARLILFSVWDFLSYAAGLARSIRYLTYLGVSTVLGSIPTLFFVWIGSVAMEDTRSLLLVYGLVAALVLVPLLARQQIESLLAWASNGFKLERNP